MTPFQIVVITLTTVLIAVELVRSRRLLPGRVALVRLVVWVAIGLAVAYPNSVQAVANVLGIGRGADVVLYGLVIAFVAVSFYFYSRQVQLQRQLTELVRRQALADVRKCETQQIIETRNHLAVPKDEDRTTRA